MASRQSSPSAGSKAYAFITDAFLFTLVCALCILIILSAPSAKKHPEYLEEYALAQDAAETCAILQDWTPRCFSKLNSFGLSYCLKPGCGEINIERDCCGKTNHLGVNLSDYQD